MLASATKLLLVDVLLQIDTFAALERHRTRQENKHTTQNIQL